MTVLFAGFVVFILSLVFFSVSQKFHLVEKDYYQKELQYQARLDQIKRFRENPGLLRWSIDKPGNRVVFEYDSTKSAGISGKVLFFRPADESLDFSVPLEFDESGKMYVETVNLKKGLWRIKAFIDSNDSSFYKEDIFTIE